MKKSQTPSIVALLFAFALSFSSCGESSKEKAERLQKDSVQKYKDSLRKYDSLIAPRKIIYDLAVETLKKSLKAPLTVKIPALTLTNDTVKIGTLTGTKDAAILFPYDAQNAMGTYLRGYASYTMTFDTLKQKYIVEGDFGRDDPSFYDHFEEMIKEINQKYESKHPK